MTYSRCRGNRFCEKKLIALTACIIYSCHGLSPISHIGNRKRNIAGGGHRERAENVSCPLRVTISPSILMASLLTNDNNDDTQCPSYEISSPSSTRRSFLNESTQLLTTMTISMTTMTYIDQNNIALAANQPEITSKVFLEVKGLPNEDQDASSLPSPGRIVIGLYGKLAPQPTQILAQLFSSKGYNAKCKPPETRTLQREQLEANKVYNSCIGSNGLGVSYDSSTVWRVIKDERIDFGAVSGKFVSRESPTFEVQSSETMVVESGLKHDREGVVSVRRGDDGGFGFMIYPGDGGKGVTTATTQLDEDNIIVGEVISGIDVVRRLNELPVVRSTGANLGSIMGGGASKRSAPSRGCRYGGNESFCSEFKPLKKILISNSGVL